MNNNLKTMREQRDWAQGELVGRLGVSRQGVNALEADRCDPSLPLAFRIAALFDRPIGAGFRAGDQAVTTQTR